MTAREFAAIRAQIGVSDDALASRLGVPPRLLSKWADGKVPVADRFARVLEALPYEERRDDLLAAVRITKCPVAEDVFARTRAGGKMSTTEALNYSRHARMCSVCKARDQYVTSKLGAAPRRAPPTSAPGRVYAAVVEQIGRLPQWGRPAAAGAIILFGTMAIRMADRLPVILFGLTTLKQDIRILAVPFLAAIGGAAGGFGYTFLGKPLRRIAVVGRYLAGIVSAASYMAALVFIFQLAGTPFIKSERQAVNTAILIVLAGVFVGYRWLRPDNPDELLRTAGVMD